MSNGIKGEGSFVRMARRLGLIFGQILRGRTGNTLSNEAKVRLSGLLILLPFILLSFLVMWAMRKTESTPPRRSACTTTEEQAIGITREWTEGQIAPYVAAFDWRYDFFCDESGWAMRWGFTEMNGSIHRTALCGSGKCEILDY
jgi:hypothetical protein